MLTYNVKALPWTLGGWNKGARMRRIGARLDRYDLVLLQEAFTALPDLLAGLAQRGLVVSERYGAARVDVGISGSTGLAVAAFPPLTGVARPHFDHYSTCSGTFTRANDCLASKGFVMQRVAFAGIEIDVYDTHLDAAPADSSTRTQQLHELADAVHRLSDGRPVIMAGDFNIDRRNATELVSLRRFAERVGLTDSAAPSGEEWPERLDYIFFRGSSAVGITLRCAGDDPSFRTETTHLSDHPALFAILEVTRLGSGVAHEQRLGQPAAPGVAEVDAGARTC